MDVTVESSLMTLYQFYSNMKFFGKFSIFELDEMLPFEREIYLGLLNKTLEERNQQNKAQNNSVR